MKLLKKIVLILILSVATLFVMQGGFYNALVYFDVMKPCYRADKNPIEIFKQEGFDYFASDKKVTEDGLKKLANRDLKAKDFKVPTISHHIYFTFTKNPTKLNAYYSEKMKATFNKLNIVDPSWRHYIWTNMPEIFPEELLKIHGVEIKSINEFKDHQLYPYLVEVIKKGDDLKPYFAEASDILRLVALEKFGGMYNDMDYEIFNPAELLKLMKEFDFLSGREITRKFGYYGNSFIAAKLNHPIIDEAVNRIIRNHVLNNRPDYIKYPCSEHARIYVNGPPLLTMSYFAKNNINGNNDIILPTWMIFNATFARFKNIDCNYNAVTKELFNQREENLQHLLEIYPINTKEEGVDDSNIYYSIRDRKAYPIIGADMFCGGWSKNSKAIKKRKYYF
jgi:mannosyltransferase OCH1-like enzyme